MTLGQRIRQLRKKRGYSRDDFARMIKSCYFTIYKWEKDSSEPSLYFVTRICKSFGISLDEFMEGVELRR